ncbi:response regulator [Carboxylicivirga marina]|uniref:response regulator n=1 Tax=Carboxylicivirga marina TaxID=2800988 RepID=UPI002591E7F6|nr:response regulator [uncultured Carboxylicivirga sp.]
MKKQQRLKYYLVDDSSEFIEAIKLYIEYELKGTIIGSSSDGKLAISDNRIFDADVIIMDIVMKYLDGFSTSTILTETNPQLKIIAVTNSQEYITKRQLLSSGFSGCICKNCAFEELPLAISRVFEGKYHFSSDLLIDN